MKVLDKLVMKYCKDISEDFDGFYYEDFRGLKANTEIILSSLKYSTIFKKVDIATLIRKGYIKVEDTTCFIRHQIDEEEDWQEVGSLEKGEAYIISKLSPLSEAMNFTVTEQTIKQEEILEIEGAVNTTVNLGDVIIEPENSKITFNIEQEAIKLDSPEDIEMNVIFEGKGVKVIEWELKLPTEIVKWTEIELSNGWTITKN